MNHLFTQFVERISRAVRALIGRPEPKRSWAGAPPREQNASSPPPAESGTAMPLGARFRPRTSGYSMSVAQMEEVSQGLREIPPLPQGALQVMRELDSQEASAASVAEVIGREPVMAASVLRIANSAAMGLRREITSVSEAVTYLGFSMTKSLFLRLKMTALLPSPQDGRGYDTDKLWIHSVAVSQAAEEIARRAGGTDPHLALTAGLLHDIGRLAINSQHAHQLEGLWSATSDSSESLLDRERRLFGADHAFIGAALATEWKLPHDLVEIIRLHHLPDDQPIKLQSTVRRALLAIYVANQLVKYRHVYCKNMEIDEVPAAVTEELALPNWVQLLADERLRRTIDRAVLLNGGAQASAVAA